MQKLIFFIITTKSIIHRMFSMCKAWYLMFYKTVLHLFLKQIGWVLISTPIL